MPLPAAGDPPESLVLFFGAKMIWRNSMDTKTIINQLKYEAEKHKNDSLFTGQTNITALCSDLIPKLEKLAEYETAEEEGRLVVLPCKVEDTVTVF